MTVPNTHNSCWNNFCQYFSFSHWNPKNWDFTSKKTAQYAAIVLLTCIVVVIVSALLVQHPQAMGAFFTVIGMVGVASLIVLAVSAVKYLQRANMKKENKA